MMIKPQFKSYFDEDIIFAEVDAIPTRTDCKLSKYSLERLNTIESLDVYSNGFILNLFAFPQGLHFLLNHKQELLDRGLIMYLFSSPFMLDDMLLDLLNDNDIIEYCDDSWLEHLYINPNIWM
jgi:hypothetical protein